MTYKRVLAAIAMVAVAASPALAQGNSGGNGGGNGSMSGSHYNLNIIGVEKGKSATLAGSNRHTIFVWLGKNGTVSSKIYLVPGEEFKVCDGNATDGVAARAGPRTFARVAQGTGGWRAELVVGVVPGA